MNFADNANIAAYVNMITDNRRPAEPPGFNLFVTDGYTMS